MKRILIINPNTSEEMTEQCRITAMRVKSDDVQLKVISPSFGPKSLECFYEYTLAGFAVVREYKLMNEHFDGVLLACFGDPGLYALKNITDCPTIGIAESSFALSCVMGQRFGLLVTTASAVPMMLDLIRQYGFEKRLAAIEAINTSVLDTEAFKEESVKKLTAAGKAAIAKGAEVLILGCAGMTGLKGSLEQILRVPVIDPVEAGYITLEGMVRAGINISRTGLYSPPPEKQIIGGEQIINLL